MKVKLLIPSVYCESVIQVYIYTLTGYRAGALLRYYRTGMQRAVLHIAPMVKEQGRSCLLVSAPMAVYEKKKYLPAWQPSG